MSHIKKYLKVQTARQSKAIRIRNGYFRGSITLLRLLYKMILVEEILCKIIINIKATMGTSQSQ